MDPMLREAAQTGNVVALYTLIEANPHVLEGMEEIPFIETPLHVAAARGHIEFSMLVMSLKPSFGRKLNRNLKSPMHLALENGQTQMVLEFLKVDKDLVRVKGRDGKTPIHCAVELGETDILVEFLMNIPECIRDVTAKGETCLHIATRENTAALEVLVGWLRRSCQKDARNLEDQILNWTDMKGNTLLHIAAYENQEQALKLLSECRSVKKKIRNSEGLTAMEIVEQRRQPRLGNNEYSQRILHHWRISNCFRLTRKKEKAKVERLRSKMSRCEQIMTSLTRSRVNTTNEMINAMLVVAALIITVSFQGVLAPPGGVLQASIDNSNTTSTICDIKCNNSATSPACSIICSNNLSNNTTSFSNISTSEGQPSPGMSVVKLGSFLTYWIFNTLAFLLSAAVTIIILPRNFLGTALNIAFAFLFYSYAGSVFIVSPSPALGSITWYICSHIYSMITACSSLFWSSWF